MVDDWLSWLRWCILHDWLAWLDLLGREGLVCLWLLGVSLVSSVVVCTCWVDLLTLVGGISKGGVELADVGEVAVPGETEEQTNGPGVDNGTNDDFALILGVALSHTLALEGEKGGDECKDLKDA